MKITVNRRAFLAAYDKAAVVVPARSPKPILSNVHLQAMGKSLTFSATDGEAKISATCESVGTEKSGVALLPAMLAMASELLKMRITRAIINQLAVLILNLPLNIKSRMFLRTCSSWCQIKWPRSQRATTAKSADRESRVFAKNSLAQNALKECAVGYCTFSDNRPTRPRSTLMVNHHTV